MWLEERLVNQVLGAIVDSNSQIGNSEIGDSDEFDPIEPVPSLVLPLSVTKVSGGGTRFIKFNDGCD